VGHDIVLSCKGSNIITVISFIGEQVFGFNIFYQGDRPRRIVALPGCHNEVQRVTQRVTQTMNFS
jgi:hypothetical protein